MHYAGLTDTVDAVGALVVPSLCLAAPARRRASLRASDRGWCGEAQPRGGAAASQEDGATKPGVVGFDQAGRGQESLALSEGTGSRRV